MPRKPSQYVQPLCMLQHLVVVKCVSLHILRKPYILLALSFLSTCIFQISEAERRTVPHLCDPGADIHAVAEHFAGGPGLEGDMAQAAGVDIADKG